jgi:hypothetical protein
MLSSGSDLSNGARGLHQDFSTMKLLIQLGLEMVVTLSLRTSTLLQKLNKIRNSFSVLIPLLLKAEKPSRKSGKPYLT